MSFILRHSWLLLTSCAQQPVRGHCIYGRRGGGRSEKGSRNDRAATWGSNLAEPFDAKPCKVAPELFEAPLAAGADGVLVVVIGGAVLVYAAVCQVGEEIVCAHVKGGQALNTCNEQLHDREAPLRWWLLSYFWVAILVSPSL